jgi:hypothetical protein
MDGFLVQPGQIHIRSTSPELICDMNNTESPIVTADEDKIRWKIRIGWRTRLTHLKCKRLLIFVKL